MQLMRHSLYWHEPITPSVSDRELRRKCKIKLPSRLRGPRPPPERVGFQPSPDESILDWV
eukprot:3627402-Rhodomonas_salina.1